MAAIDPRLLFGGATGGFALLFLVLAAISWRRGRQKPHVKLWSLFCVVATLFAVSVSVSTFASSSAVGVVAIRAALTFAALGLLSMAAFVLAFAADVVTARLRRIVLRVMGAVCAVLIILYWTSDLILGGVTASEYAAYAPVAGPLMPLHGAYLISAWVLSLYLLDRIARRGAGVSQVQAVYSLLAFITGSAGTIGTLLPSWTGDYRFITVAPALLLPVWPLLITYAIIKHQLWEIRTVVHKTALWAVASLVIVVPVYLLLRRGATVVVEYGDSAAVAAALVLLAVFALHFKVLQPRLDQLFARRSRDPLKLLDAFNREIANLRGVRALAELVRDTIRTGIHARSVRMWVVADPEGRFLRLASGRRRSSGEKLWALPPALRLWLVAHRREVELALLEEYELSDEERVTLRALGGEGAALLLPLVRDDEVLGVVELGEKQSLRAYTREDFQILERIRPAATVALANAQLYDQLHELTVSLDRRVQQRTAELQQVNARLVQADRQKSKFFANITHELKTPLTMILAPLEDLLLEVAPDDRLRQELETVRRNAMRLLRQIDGLLDLAKRDAGALRLSVRALSLTELVEEEVASFLPLAHRKGVALTMTAPDGSLEVLADGQKLALAVSNLLANAVKFTPAGGDVAVELRGDGAWAAVAVRDSGIGIPEDQLERIFERFAQVESGPARRFEGAGIGLSLVKEVVQLHGGMIEVTSNEQQGSAFTLRIRRDGAGIAEEVRDRRRGDQPTGYARRAEDRDPVGATPVKLDGDAWLTVEAEVVEGGELAGPADAPRVLIVEDNPDMRQYLERRLSAHFQVEVTADGVAALEALRRSAPDLVVADVMMPELSGDELCRLIKAAPATASIPVILVTARKGVDCALEGYSAGADDYLTKPFNLRELLARIRVQLRLVDMGRRLARQEKGLVLNLVAAGLAHEVRNPINAIINAVRPLLEGELLGASGGDDQSPAEELLRVVLDSAQRVDTLVGDLLGVARSHVDELADWRLDAALDSTLRLLKYKHGAEVHVQRTLAHRVPVVGRTAQLNQVLMNVLDNAIKAGGAAAHIEVTTETAGERFILRVGDDGPGVPSGAEERVFDPLYTTGDAASHGLGLHISRQIVEDHGGRITVRRSRLGGAEVVVELPHMPAPEARELVQPQAAGDRLQSTAVLEQGRKSAAPLNPENG